MYVFSPVQSKKNPKIRQNEGFFPGLLGIWHKKIVNYSGAEKFRKQMLIKGKFETNFRINFSHETISLYFDELLRNDDRSYAKIMH